jgi:hypothetical protein
MVRIGKQKCSVISNLKIMFVGGEIDERCGSERCCRISPPTQGDKFGPISAPSAAWPHQITENPRLIARSQGLIDFISGLTWALQRLDSAHCSK